METYLFEVKERRISVIKFGVNKGGSDRGRSFKIKHRSQATEIKNLQEGGGEQECGDVMKGEIRIKGNANLAHRRVGGERKR